MTKAEIKDLAPIPVVVIICLNPREARVEVLGMTIPVCFLLHIWMPGRLN